MNWLVAMNIALAVVLVVQSWRHPRRVGKMYEEIVELRAHNDALRKRLEEARTELAYAEKNRR